MRINKPHSEFSSVDLTKGFAPPPGYPPGFAKKILAGSLDEKNKKGSRTRLLKIEPGAYSTEPFPDFFLRFQRMHREKDNMVRKTLLRTALTLILALGIVLPVTSTGLTMFPFGLDPL